MYLKDETNVIVNINLIGRETKRGKEKNQIVRTKRQEMGGKEMEERGENEETRKSELHTRSNRCSEPILRWFYFPLPLSPHPLSPSLLPQDRTNWTEA